MEGIPATLRRMNLLGSTRSDSVVAIKTEETEDSLFAEFMEEEPLDLARTKFYFGKDQVCILEEDKVIWRLTRNEENCVVVRHPMAPDAQMDALFPIRDPKNPIAPHPLYAPYFIDEEGNKTLTKASVINAKIGYGFIASLQRLAEEEMEKPADERRLNMSKQEVKKAINLMQKNVVNEMRRTLYGQTLDNPPYKVSQIAENDVPVYESCLIGQYDLGVPDMHPDDRPTMRNGKILGIFAGARLQTDDELNAHTALYGEEEFSRYALNTAATQSARLVTYSPVGGANSMAFANTALDPNAPEPAYDYNRINAYFIPFNVEMTDKDGNRLLETVMAVLALDNIGGSVRVDYGDAYLEQFKNPSLRVKEEYVEMD